MNFVSRSRRLTVPPGCYQHQWGRGLSMVPFYHPLKKAQLNLHLACLRVFMVQSPF